MFLTVLRLHGGAVVYRLDHQNDLGGRRCAGCAKKLSDFVMTEYYKGENEH